jgi:hypothetical protein
MRSLTPIARDDHHDFLVGFLDNGRDLVHLLVSLLGMDMRHHCLEDFGGAIVDDANDVEHPPAGDPAP